MDRSALPMQSACPVENVCYSEKVRSLKFLTGAVQMKGRAVLLFLPWKIRVSQNMPDTIIHRLTAPVFLHSFFYLQIIFSTWFIIKTFPPGSFLFFPQNNNAPKSLQNLLF